MNLPFTQKKLIDWAGEQVFKDAEVVAHKGAVIKAEYEEPFITGSVVWNNRPVDTALEILPDGNVENHCPCWINQERGIICPHVIAMALVIIKRSTDPLREQKYQAEQRKASRINKYKEEDYIQRVMRGTPGCAIADIHIEVDGDIAEQVQKGLLLLKCSVKSGSQTIPFSEVSRDVPFCFNKKDESLLYVLEDIAEGPPEDFIEVSTADFINILELLGSGAITVSGAPALINPARLPTTLMIDLDRENGELLLIVQTPTPLTGPQHLPLYLLSTDKGWIYQSGNFWPLETILPLPYHPVYRETIPVRRDDVVQFIKSELPQLEERITIQPEIPLDLFTFEPAHPRMELRVQGSPASLSGSLYALYGNQEFPCCKPDPAENFGIPDPDDLLRYETRNPHAEKQALEILAPTGFRGEIGDALTPIIDNRLVTNFLAGAMPRLRRHGWRIKISGKVENYVEGADFATPVVHVESGSGQGWFDVGFSFEDSSGNSISQAEIQQALQRGEYFIRKNNSTVLIDADAVESMYDVFSDCDASDGSAPGFFRLSDVYAPFVKSSLDALDGIDVENPAHWQNRASNFNRTAKLEPVAVAPSLQKTLRGYQHDGIAWLYFLEKSGFCGILADEMGLGKTIQTLAWLDVDRAREDVRGRPALVVCPTSLVQNWIEEAAKFTPDMNAIPMIGSDRHEHWPEIGATDLVVTSYALLRRDLEKYLEHEFSVAILDEAQHIKNRSTQNAQAAKQINAFNRLVLTGTPVENSVSDLWSIMDFLMPGYLGSHELFRRKYELPISKGGPEAQDAQVKLKRKLHPFLLRRLKKTVAKELPDKIEKVAHCQLTADQKAVYTTILQSARKNISNLVANKGFNKVRMEVLTTLLKLRQACCHLDLLKMPGLNAKAPSAKLDLFMELVDEAVDGGHRILVFSQFVSMLSILRKELEDRGYSYCYLDGSTKNRMEVVHQFNSSRDIPLFLISLKAGGTGLNLTGADMVIHFDPWWNPAVEQQATDRAYRIGQKNTVYSMKLITTGTVEEKVLALQERKREVINATVESDEEIMSRLSWEDMQELLEL